MLEINFKFIKQFLNVYSLFKWLNNKLFSFSKKEYPSPIIPEIKAARWCYCIAYRKGNQELKAEMTKHTHTKHS